MKDESPGEGKALPIVEFEGVSVALGDRVVLEDITLSIPPAQFLAVLGPNGSGKTTLLRTMLGQVRPVKGRVSVYGKPPWRLGSERRRIGYVPQIENVDLRFPVHVGDLVMMGRYGRVGLVRRPGKADREAVRKSMTHVGIEDLTDRAIGDLSGGQRQRAFLARALAGEPELLLLDEPTTGVDVAATEDLYLLLRHLQLDLNLTLVLVTHDIGVVSRHVDQIACLNRVLVAHGRPEDTLRPEALECMYGHHAMLFGHGVPSHVFVSPPNHEKGG